MRVLLGLVLLALLVGGALAWLVGTQSGLNAAVHIAARFSPGALQVEHAQGRLWDEVTLHGVAYVDEGLRMEARRLHLAWTASALLRERHLHVQRLEADGLRVHQDPAEASDEDPARDEPFVLPQIDLPVRITLDAAQLKDITLAFGDTDIHFAQLHLRAHSADDTLHIEEFALHGDDFALSGAGRVAPRGDWPLAWEGPWRARVDASLVAEGHVQLSGSLAELNVAQRLDAPARANLDARVSLTGESPTWSARLSAEPLQTARLNPEWPVLEVGGEITGAGGFEQFSLQLDLEGKEPLLGRLALRGEVAREPGQWHAQDLMLTSADAARVALNGHWADADGPQRFAARVLWEELNWPLDGQPPLARSRSGTAQIEGRLEDYSVQVEARLEGPEIPAGRWTLAGRGNPERFTVERLRGELLQGELTASGHLSWADGLRWEAQLTAHGLAPGMQWEAAEGLQVGARLHGAGDAEQFDVEGDVRLDHEAYGALAADLALRRGADAWELSRAVITQPGQPGRIDVGGHWRDAEGPQRLALHAQWEALALEAWGVHSPRGRVDVQGSPEAYRFSLSARVEGDDLPSGDWQARGTGSSAHGDLAELRGETLEGTLVAQGQVRWDPRLEWDLALDVAGVNPGAQWEAWPGNLNLALQSDGHIEHGQPRARATLTTRPSQLRGRALSAEVSVEADGERYTVHQLAVTADDARVTMRGSLNERWDVDWAVHAPDLGALLPDAAGRLDLDGKLHGPRTAPRLALSATGDRLTLEENRVERLRAEADVDLEGNTRSRLVMELHDVEAAGQVWERIKLEGAGIPEDHRLEATIEQVRYTLHTGLTGAYAARRWQGMVRDTRLDAAPLPTWEQEHPAALSVGAEAARLDTLCLSATAGAGQLCLAGQWDGPAGQTQAQARLTRVPLALLHPLLVQEVELEGDVGGEAEINLTAEGLVVDARLVSDGGDLYYALAADERLRVPYKDFALTAQTRGEDLIARLSVNLAEQDFVRGEVTVAGIAGDPQALATAALRGRIQAELRILELVPLFLPELSDTHGLLSAEVTLGGTVQAPQAGGTVALAEGRAHLLATGITLEDLNLRLSGEGDEWTLDGSARSGPGEISVAGELELADAWRAVVTLDGERFELAKMPEARVLVTPALSVVVVPGAITIEGSVTVPEARLEPHDLGGAVTPTQDVMIVRGDNDGAPDPAGWRVTSRIRLVLGDRVRFDGFGLTGSVRGSLRLVDEPGQVTTAAGELNIVDGHYRAYGQNLRIDRGRLLFAVGQPLDNPGLDIRAVRVTRDVLAGVSVRGTLQLPELALFSEPSMDQANVLSYLLLGRPLGQASQTEGEALYGAATAISLVGGERIAQSIGDALGIEEVRIEETPEAADTGPSLVLGTYLSPRLYVNYSVGLFQSVNVLRVRYELTRHWMLQTETGGPHEGADLIYSIERGGPDAARSERR